MTEIQFMTSMHHWPFLSKIIPNTGIQKKFFLTRKFVRIGESFGTIRSHPSIHDCDLLRFIKYEEYILILSALKSSRSSSNLNDWSFYAAGDNLGGIPSWLCFRHFKLKHHLKFKNDSITRLNLLRMLIRMIIRLSMLIRWSHQNEYFILKIKSENLNVWLIRNQNSWFSNMTWFKLSKSDI